MKDDTISRQAVIEILATMQGLCTSKAALVQNSKIWQQVKNLPSTGPMRKKGKWIKISPANIYECSECGKYVMANDIYAYKFCRGCGADMSVYER